MTDRRHENPSPLSHVIIIHSLFSRNLGLGELAEEMSRPEPQFCVGKVRADTG